METDIVCPECGKVIAPPGAVDNSARCRCAEEKESRKAVDASLPRVTTTISIPTESADEDSSNDVDAAVAKAKTEKKCYVCGKSLEGRTRLKDHLGRYWCKECAAADKRMKKREDELRCPDCSRVFPAHKLVYFQATRVCQTCFKEREKALEKKIVKATVNKNEKRAELATIKWLAIAVIVLLLLGWCGRFVHLF